jgi:2-keto-4-pentenoate hydratase/2-oxohepta-3-ene-1,7-dioic acid hydratase in catechol pathway/rubrerythrin
MNPRTDLWLQNLVDERDGAALYEGLAKYEKDQDRARSFLEIAEAERRHAEIWRRKLEKEGVAIPNDRPSSRVRALVWLARRLGTNAVVPMVLEAEAGDAEKYDAQGGEATAIADEERAHRRTVAAMGRGQPTEARELIASRERWHRSSSAAGSIRAAIFGMNDGLVSNLSLILGVAGAGVEPRTVVVTGFAGLLAGAFSMAAGEYTSVASQRDLLTRQVALERREIDEEPEEEAAELALIFKQKGLSTEQASRTAAELLKNPESAADTLVREELGLDPNELGSPILIGVAAEHIAGYCLLNDWSARDLQAWEYQPLGPFLAKNFLTSVSPWVVSPEALLPFRKPMPPRPQGDPEPLPYLDDSAERESGALGIELEVTLSTERMRAEGAAPHVLSRGSADAAMYWSAAQIIAHHTSNGCNLQPGDLIGTGTLSTESDEGLGSLLEISQGGKSPVELPSGETRSFLEDGDEITLKAWCESEGHPRIGFGECIGRVVGSA